MQPVNEFPPEVAAELGYYVYRTSEKGAATAYFSTSNAPSNIMTARKTPRRTTRTSSKSFRASGRKVWK